jgi:2-polyprenyl-3-methyl-5-hydroxy-6-metoxy-1,4-benzoquinol methylase
VTWWTEQVSTAGEKFDAVCSLEVIEHTADPQLYLQNCAACIKVQMVFGTRDVGKMRRDFSFGFAALLHSPEASCS